MIPMLTFSAQLDMEMYDIAKTTIHVHLIKLHQKLHWPYLTYRALYCPTQSKAYTLNLILLVARDSPYTSLVIDKKRLLPSLKHIPEHDYHLKCIFQKTMATYRSGYIGALRVRMNAYAYEKMPMKHTSQMPITDFQW